LALADCGGAISPLKRDFALAHDDEVVCPGDFSNQRLESFLGVVFGIEQAHIPEVLNWKTANTWKFLPQIG